LKAEDRRFVFTVAAAFVALTGILMWRGKPVTAMVPAALAAMLMLVSVLFPASIPRIHRAWMAGAHAISRITTPIILGMVYYLVLTPTGLIRRALGKSSLRPRLSNDSYWVAREVKARPPADMRRQF
jgi:predicted membrane-bound dolichyl-phosphate-mannose-protein mannosyltransferase